MNTKMKLFKNAKSSLLILTLSFFLTSCSVTKCRYNNGFNIELNVFGKKEANDKKTKTTKRLATSKIKNDSIIEQALVSKDTLIKKEMVFKKQIEQPNVCIEQQASVKSKENQHKTPKLIIKSNTFGALKHQKTAVLTQTKNNKQIKVKKTSFWDTDFGSFLIDVGMFILELILGTLILLLGLWIATLPLGAQILILVGIIIISILIIQLFVDAVFDFLLRK